MSYLFKILLVDLSDAQLASAMFAFPFIALALIWAAGSLMVRS